MDAYLEKTLNEMESATRGLTDHDLNTFRLAADGWTAAQTLEHLILTFTGTTRNLRKIREGKTTLPAATLKQRIGRFVVVGMGYMPQGRSAPEFTRPDRAPSTDVCERFRRAIREMDAAIAARERNPATQKVAVHPLLGPLTAREWRKFHLVHTRHHMQQIRAMRRSGHQTGASAA